MDLEPLKKRARGRGCFEEEGGVGGSKKMPLPRLRPEASTFFDKGGEHALKAARGTPICTAVLPEDMSEMSWV
jgi:hypothetical protein